MVLYSIKQTKNEPIHLSNTIAVPYLCVHTSQCGYIGTNSNLSLSFEYNLLTIEHNTYYSTATKKE